MSPVPARARRAAPVAKRPAALSLEADAEALTTTLRRLRLQLGLSQQGLAARLGVAKLTVARWEHGRCTPSPAHQQRLAALVRAVPVIAALAAPGLAPPPPDRPQRGLPVLLSSFVGRERELSALRDHLAHTRLLTLTGPGGSGKTRLALRLAELLPDRFPASCWFVDLSSVSDGGMAPSAVAAALGVPEQAGRSVTDGVCAALGAKDALLLLDNCEHLLPTCAVLVRTLLDACPRLRIVATSRELLGLQGEQVYGTPPLALPAADGDAGDLTAAGDAVRLFVERARERQPALLLESPQLALIAAICRRLDGLPLALELAAARVGLLSLADLGAHLDDRFRLLRSADPTAPLRHQTLKRAIDWSYALLSPPEQALFAQLGSFAGGFDLAAVEAVCRVEPTHEPSAAEPSPLELLGRLVDRSLVVAEVLNGRSRYRLLETLRVYACEWLSERSLVDAVGERHAAYYLALARAGSAQAKGAGQREGLDLLAAELPNLRVALAWYLTHGDAAHAIQLAAWLTGFWNVRGPREGRAWLQRALACPGVVAPAERAFGLVRAGSLARMEGDYSAAEALLHEALALFQETKRTVDMASCLALLAAVGLDTGDQRATEDFATEALAALGGSEHDETRMLAYNVLGLAALLDGEALQARERLEQAVRYAERLGRRDVLALLATNLGIAAYRLQELDAADAWYDTAARLAADLDDRRAPFYTQVHRCMLCLRRGELAAATAQARSAVETANMLGFPDGVCIGIETLGLVAAARGEAERAARLLAFVDAWRARAGLVRRQNYQEELALARVRVRAALSEERFAAIAAAATVEPIEQVMAEALAWAAAWRTEGERELVDFGARSDQGSSLAEAGLSAREREILALAARGMNPWAIARELVLSARTVERHLANIYAKIGVHSRAEAIARVLGAAADPDPRA